MLSKYDVTLSSDKPIMLPDPGERAEPEPVPTRSSALTGTPAAPPAESPAPSAPLKTPPRRLRDDREEVSRIGRRANEELTKEIFEYRTRLFKGEPGYTTEG